VTKGLSRFLDDEKSSGIFKGIRISQELYISHLLFFYDILIFCDGSRHDTNKLCEGIYLFKRASGMIINDQKSTISYAYLEADEIRYYVSKLSFHQLDMDEGLKYLGFQLKPNDYRKIDWMWLIEKMERRLKV